MSTINWLRNNNLNLNINKTNYLQFNNIHNLNIKFNDSVVSNVDCTKFLGIDVDDKLNWKNQIERICNKLNRFSYALGKLKNIASRKTALTAYFAYVESVLRYGVIIWGNSTNLNKSFIAQKKCIRSIMGVAQDKSCRPFFHLLNILPLACLYIMEAAIFVKQNLSIFTKTKDVTSRNLRNTNTLVYEVIPKTARFRKNCYGMCLTIWNKLPCQLKTIAAKHRFKKSLKRWLLQHIFYSIKEFLEHEIKNCILCADIKA